LKIWRALRLPADWNDEKNEELLDDLERGIAALHVEESKTSMSEAHTTKTINS
jgi:hypothetical protein